jgi:hypothetical protein
MLSQQRRSQDKLEGAGFMTFEWHEARRIAMRASVELHQEQHGGFLSDWLQLGKLGHSSKSARKAAAPGIRTLFQYFSQLKHRPSAAGSDDGY